MKLSQLLPEASVTPAALAAQLEDDPSTLEALVSAALRSRPAWAELLLFVDQLLLADQALDRLGWDRARLIEPVASFVRPEAERLLEEVREAVTAHDRRAEIGDRLAEISDPRPGVGLTRDGLPDLVWCPIPAGRVTLDLKQA